MSGPTLVGQYFIEPSKISSVSSYMKSWFLEYRPNEAFLLYNICHYLFPGKTSSSDEGDILHEFPGPQNLQELVKGDEGVRYTVVKRDLS